MSENESGKEKFARVHEIIEANSGDDMNLFVTIKTAREAGIPLERIKAYALTVMAGDLKRGYGHPDVVEMIHRIAKNSKIASPEEIDELIQNTPVDERTPEDHIEVPDTEDDPVQAAIDTYGYESPEHQLAAWEAYERSLNNKE